MYSEKGVNAILTKNVVLTGLYIICAPYWYRIAEILLISERDVSITYDCLCKTIVFGCLNCCM